MSSKRERLLAGESFITSEKGNSMLPLIKSGEPFRLIPYTLEQAKIGDIVYCRVHGRFFTHLVKAKNNEKGVQIGNNHGHINGWTKNVYGKVEKL